MDSVKTDKPLAAVVPRETAAKPVRKPRLGVTKSPGSKKGTLNVKGETHVQ